MSKTTVIKRAGDFTKHPDYIAMPIPLPPNGDLVWVTNVAMRHYDRAINTYRHRYINATFLRGDPKAPTQAQVDMLKQANIIGLYAHARGDSE